MFRIPNIVGRIFAPGAQPYSPGNSHQAWGGHMGMQFSAMPWPTPVQSINALANNSGTPRSRAPIPVVNRYSPLPSDYLIIGGIVEKSKG